MKTEVFPLLHCHLKSFPLFSYFFCLFLGARLVDVAVAFLNDSVFNDSIENNAFSNVSALKALHFEQYFQMSPFLIIVNGNARPKQRHSTPFCISVREEIIRGLPDTKPIVY